MGLNDNFLLYRTDATCEKLRLLASNIWDHQCLQLRRCLVGSPGCRVEALQRPRFPQPAVCGGDIWSEKYPEHMWLQNNSGSAANVSRTHKRALWLIWWGMKLLPLGLIPKRAAFSRRAAVLGRRVDGLSPKLVKWRSNPRTVRKSDKTILFWTLFFFLKRGATGSDRLRRS